MANLLHQKKGMLMSALHVMLLPCAVAD